VELFKLPHEPGSTATSRPFNAQLGVPRITIKPDCLRRVSSGTPFWVAQGLFRASWDWNRFSDRLSMTAIEIQRPSGPTRTWTLIAAWEQRRRFMCPGRGLVPYRRGEQAWHRFEYTLTDPEFTNPGKCATASARSTARPNGLPMPRFLDPGAAKIGIAAGSGPVPREPKPDLHPGKLRSGQPTDGLGMASA